MYSSETMPKPRTVRQQLDDFLEMLRYMRPAGSRTERKFINRFIRPLGVTQDPYGNLIKRIGDAPVLWSSHTDTVHKTGGKQTVVVQGSFVTAPRSNCLGADCTTGVWLMREMVLAGVPGLYVWHREEEYGGGGSSYIAKTTPNLLDGIKYAIAFDRYGLTSVITHQGSRCCSNEFAESLIDQLGTEWQRDDGGTFTDTANYTDLIGECTNISVGYYNQHRATEKQDLDHAFQLLELVKHIDINKLVCKRKAGDDDFEYRSRYYKSSYNKGPYPDYSRHYMELWDDNEVTYHPAPSHSKMKQDDNHSLLIDLCKENPEAIADFLDMMGISANELYEHIWGDRFA